MQHLAYEYARRGARLALVARRTDRLQKVADEARQLGSPDVIVIIADVSKIEDCKRFVNTTVNHFGQCKPHLSLVLCSWFFFMGIRPTLLTDWFYIYSTVDHLVNNAGVAHQTQLFKEMSNISDFVPVMVSPYECLYFILCY